MHNGSPKRILVRGPNWLGDAVMCEPALRGVRRITPDAKISLLVKPAIAELFLGHPAVDDIIRYEDKGSHAGLRGKWALAGKLRRENFDLALLFQNAFEAALLSFLAGIPRRFGYATDSRSLLLSEAVATPDRRAPSHQVHYYWDLLRPMGLTGDPPAPALSVTDQEEAAMTTRLELLGIPASGRIIGVNPGSTYGGAKRWLPERFAEVTDRICLTLAESEGRQISVVVLGARGEEPVGREIAERLTVRSAVLTGATTIRELMAVLKRCDLLLTNDTGPMHIASALQIPVVAIFGPTDWRTTSPYGAPHAVVRQAVDCAPCFLRECPIDHRCMTRISVEQVYESAMQLNPLGQETRGARRVGVRTSVESLARPPASPTGHAPLDGVTVFLDRDGTLNHDTHYLKSPAELALLPGVAASLARLKIAGAKLIVVTNQSGVGRGLLTLKDLEMIHARLQGLLEQEGAVLDAIYFCPHHPDDGCRCRKPERGMIDRAVAEFQVDLRRSYLVGNHVRDMQLARAAGAKPILVTTEPVDSRARDVLQAERAMPDRVVPTLVEAVDWIITDAYQDVQLSATSHPPGSMA